MKAQFYASRSGSRSLVWGEPLRIEQLAGEFAVLSGRVWLTREGDMKDYVLAAGETFDVAPGDVVVAEPWRRGEPALIAWRPGRRVQSPVATPRRRVASVSVRAGVCA